MIYSRIVGTGSCLPENVVTNADLATRVETSDEWIRTRTGICQRHLAAFLCYYSRCFTIFYVDVAPSSRSRHVELPELL